jgi:hypothetical protein
MTDLIQRLQDASEGSRELDAEIAAHLKIYTGQFDYAREWQGAWEPEINGMVHLINNKGQRSLNFVSPRYTGSIDAAMTLYEVPPDMVPSCPRKACIAALRARSECRE